MDWLGVGSRRFSRAGQSLYGELELPKGAAQSDIKRQYKRLALKYHPDKNSGSPEAAEKFKEINRAHRTLTDPKKKDIYDKYGSFGIHLAEQFGDDNVKVYASLSSWWCQSLLVCSAIFSLCCCCCCCCFCCGKCLSKEEDEVPDTEELERDGIADADYEFAPRTQQPRASVDSSRVYVIPLPQADA